MANPSTKTKRHFRVAVIVLLILALLLVIVPAAGLSIFLNRHIDYRGYETADDPLQGLYLADDYGLSENQMYLQTEDGYEIWCSEIAAESPKGVVIYLTGIMQPSITYFYGHAAYLLEQGYSSVLLEVRGHGNSAGKQIGLGYTEVADVEAVVDYIKASSRYDDVPIVMHGVSMGGAIALNAFGQIPELDGCIAMSAYASFEQEVDLLLQQLGIPSVLRKLEQPVVHATLRLLYGAEAVRTQRPDLQIQNAGTRPVFLIACSEDNSVPVAHTYRLKEAWPSAQIWIRDSWEHFIIRDCDFRGVAADTEYWQQILAFLEQV